MIQCCPALNRPRSGSLMPRGVSQLVRNARRATVRRDDSDEPTLKDERTADARARAPVVRRRGKHGRGRSGLRTASMCLWAHPRRAPMSQK